MSTLYLSLKALHILAVISWMAGMLYLPRLYVYHAECGQQSPQAKTFMVMERRLMRAIMVPAMLVTWGSGLALAVSGGFETARWLLIKVLLVIALTALHVYLARVRKNFAAAENRHSARFYRVFNEIPTILMAGIVILVVFKPN